MHQMIMLAIVAAITFGTSGYSQTFAASYRAVSRGDVSQAVDLFTTAIRNSLADADRQEQLKKAREQQLSSGAGL